MAGIGLADFTPGLQEGLIQNRGALMLHEIAFSCTCRVEDPFAGLKNDGKENRRDPYCRRCRSDGWLYRQPRVVKGLATSIRQQRNILDAGVAQPGDMQFSPSLEAPDCVTPYRSIGAYDKLTATWSQPLDDGHVLVRAAAQGLDIPTGLKQNEDRLWYEPAFAIWCEDEDNIVYTEGSDFELGPGKIIRWVGRQPAPHKRYSIKYEAFFEWIVFVPPQERRDRDDENIGQLVFLRKRHIAIVNDNPLTLPEDHVSIQSRVNC